MTPDEPSTKARELVERLVRAAVASKGAGGAYDALLTYIADLEAIAEREQERRDLHE